MALEAREVLLEGVALLEELGDGLLREGPGPRAVAEPPEVARVELLLELPLDGAARAGARGQEAR